MLSFRFLAAHLRFIPAFLSLFAASLALSACGLIGDDEDEPGTGTTDVSVLQAVMSTEITPDQQAAGFVTRAFPEGTNRVYAVIALENAEVGDEITGRWFQLSVDEAGPDGFLVNEGSVALTDENLARDGTARVSFNLAHNTGSLPNGDWLLRVYADGEQIRSMGFVISSFVQHTGEGNAPEPTPGGAAPGPTGAQEPAPTETPAAAPEPQPTDTPPPAPETYTVQSGDTLTVIAEQFKTPEETTESYVQRLLEANNLDPGGILVVGQVLTLPPPP